MCAVVLKPICIDSRECFAKIRDKDGSGKPCNKCVILTNISGYDDGDCPFCKPKRGYTDGVYYPYKRNFGATSNPLEPNAKYN